jgi:uncharacterized phage infection (PIP) family protein YhgE
MSIYKLQKPVHEAGQAVQRIRGQIEEAIELISATTEGKGALDQEAKTIIDTLDDIQNNLQSLPMGVGGSIEGSTTLPTQDQLQDIDSAWERGPRIIGRLNILISDTLPQFYQSMNAAGIRADPGETIRIPGK